MSSGFGPSLPQASVPGVMARHSAEAYHNFALDCLPRLQPQTSYDHAQQGSANSPSTATFA
eukprot:260741-Amphidinium_carterae.1